MGNILLWVVISIVALAVDVLTSSFFFAGFTIGGIAALMAYISDVEMAGQAMVFGVVSAVAVALEYFWFRKRLKKSIPATLRMEEEYIGRKVVADEDIKDRGRLKIDGIYWTAENTGGPVEKGCKVEIVGIKGNKLLVKGESDVSI